MNRYILHWGSGKPDITFANSIKEAFDQLGYGGGALVALDYYEEQKEVPYSEKLIKNIYNPVFLEQIKAHTPLSVGETMVIKMGAREFPMTVKAITGCTIEFI